jgi:predicted esterase
MLLSKYAKYKKISISLWAILLVAACTSTSSQSRRENVEQLIGKYSWERLTIPTDHFVLAAFVPREQRNSNGDTLTIYIEGDGFAFRARQVSEDPTPLNPLALELAFKHSSSNGAVAYLGRPCQYITGSDFARCDDKYWSSHRFAPEVVSSTNRAIDQLKQRAKAQHLILVGYSGGGAIAALVAANRTDIRKLVTIAGTLDHRTWTALHKVASMDSSLNPADAWQKLQQIPQIHFVGGKDRIMPTAIAESFQSRFSRKLRPEIQVVPEFDHECCWIEQWSRLQAAAFK